MELLLFLIQAGFINRSFDPYPGGFTISSQNLIRVFSDAGLQTYTISSYGTGLGSPNISQSIKDGPDIWIADVSAGLVKGVNMTTFSNFVLPGPFTNNVISITNNNGKTFITGGALDNSWNNQWRTFQVFIHENNTWFSELSNSIWDAMRVLPDPQDNNHYYVSTWGSGLLEYENNTLLHKYDDSNSPLTDNYPRKTIFKDLRSCNG